jgi:hypothetical protein
MIVLHQIKVTRVSLKIKYTEGNAGICMLMKMKLKISILLALPLVFARLYQQAVNSALARLTCMVT